MPYRRRKTNPIYYVNFGLGLAVLAVFAVTGLRVASQTSAATTNPYGFADYCKLENGVTVIYGWAADPNATSLTQPSVVLNVGGKAATVATNRAGYRDAAVNSWIDRYRAGDPKPGTYGFRATFTNLYKGSNNTITGTVLNQGAGSNTILGIVNDRNVDNDPTKPFFANNKIPDACMPAAPPSPALPPPQPPAPSQPPPSQSSTLSIPHTPSATPATPTVSGAADATVSAGTLAAEFKVPAGNAKSIKIQYGKNPAVLDLTSVEQPTNGTDTVILIAGLTPLTEYNYQIIRIDAAGKATTSPISRFGTIGFIVSLHFVDKRNQGIQGLPVTISTQDKKSETNDNGDVQFAGVPEGNHTVSYTYRDRRYTKPIVATSTTVSPTEAAAGVVTVDFTINVEETVTKDTRSNTSDSNGFGLLMLVILGVLAIGLVLFALWRRRRSSQQYDDYYLEEPAPPLPEYQPPQPHNVPPVPPIESPQLPHLPEAAHMGESLKDMVMRSMAEEARKRTHQDKDE